MAIGSLWSYWRSQAQSNTALPAELWERILNTALPLLHGSMFAEQLARLAKLPISQTSALCVTIQPSSDSCHIYVHRMAHSMTFDRGNAIVEEHPNITEDKLDKLLLKRCVQSAKPPVLEILRCVFMVLLELESPARPLAIYFDESIGCATVLKPLLAYSGIQTHAMKYNEM